MSGRAVVIESPSDEVLAKLLESPAASPPTLPPHIEASQPGTVIKAQAADRFLLVVAYPAMKADVGVAKDGFRDFARADAVEKACWAFARHGLQLGLWHEKGHEDCGEVVENCIYRGPDFTENGQSICKGDWLVGSILSPYAWEMFEKGLIGGASIEGPCRRNLTPLPEVLASLRS
ncbi:MAG: XkdF-like putative serine protease domain-containing protein [Candidatus Limnocylindrales bacterium]